MINAFFSNSKNDDKSKNDENEKNFSKKISIDKNEKNEKKINDICETSNEVDRKNDESDFFDI